MSRSVVTTKAASTIMAWRSAEDSTGAGAGGTVGAGAWTTGSGVWTSVGA